MTEAILVVCAILFLVWLAIALLTKDVHVLLIPLYVLVLPFLWAVNYSTPYGRKRMREMRIKRRKKEKRERKSRAAK